MWGRSLAIGQYVPLDSPIHRLDPRLKSFCGDFLLILSYKIGFLSIMGDSVNIFSFSFSHFFYLSLEKLEASSFSPYPYSGVAFLLLQESISGNTVFTYFPEGVSKGLLIVTRLCLLILVTSLLTLTTSPVELTDGMGIY